MQVETICNLEAVKYELLKLGVPETHADSAVREMAPFIETLGTRALFESGTGALYSVCSKIGDELFMVCEKEIVAILSILAYGRQAAIESFETYGVGNDEVVLKTVPDSETDF